MRARTANRAAFAVGVHARECTAAVASGSLFGTRAGTDLRAFTVLALRVVAGTAVALHKRENQEWPFAGVSFSRSIDVRVAVGVAVGV